MKIILLDKIQKLGEIGDIVEVNSGYARNFLIPQKKAAFASKKNITEVESRKDELAAMSADILIKAEARGKDISGSECEIAVPVTEEGALYGSVGTRETKIIIKKTSKNRGEKKLKEDKRKKKGKKN